MQTTNENNPEKQIVTILDKDGSIYFGYIVNESVTQYLIHNPAQVRTNVDTKTGQVEISVTPVCFPEFLSKPSKVNGTTWIYNKENAKFMSSADVILDGRIMEHYTKIFSATALANTDTE
jgi:hypothetical protein